MIPKYRIWHKTRKQMFDLLTINFIDQVVNIENEEIVINGESFRNVILMQSTGLTDKNGVEIFEGDIVEAERGLGIVELQPSHAPQITYKDGNDLLRFVYRFTTVFGNIYANPELLEQ